MSRPRADPINGSDPHGRPAPEPVLVRDLVDALLAHAEEFGDLDEANGDLRHGLKLPPVPKTYAPLPHRYLPGWSSVRFRWLARLDSNQD